MNDIGERLKQFRKEKGLTQEQLAENIKEARTVYNRYETGKRSIPIDLLIKLADFYQVSLDFLCGRKFSHACKNEEHDNGSEKY